MQGTLAGTKMIIAKIIYLGRQVTQAIQSSQASQSAKSTLTFRSDSLCEEHFEKHGIEMGFSSAKEYEKAAAAVVANSRALHKLEKEDGDGVF